MCNPDTFDNKIFPPSFTVFRKDRNSHGGEVMIGIKNIIPVKQLSALESLELIALELLLSKPTTFCLVHIPLGSTEYYMMTFLDYTRSLSSSNLIILGSLNFPDIGWSTLSSSNVLSNLFCDLVFQLNLVQVINFSTHPALVFTNMPDHIFDISALENKVISKILDHYPIYFLVKCSCGIKSSPGSSFPIFSKGDYVGTTDFLLDMDFESFFATNDK